MPPAAVHAETFHVDVALGDGTEGAVLIQHTTSAGEEHIRHVQTARFHIEGDRVGLLARPVDHVHGVGHADGRIPTRIGRDDRDGITRFRQRRAVLRPDEFQSGQHRIGRRGQDDFIAGENRRGVGYRREEQVEILADAHRDVARQHGAALGGHGHRVGTRLCEVVQLNLARGFAGTPQISVTRRVQLRAQRDRQFVFAVLPTAVDGQLIVRHLDDDAGVGFAAVVRRHEGVSGRHRRTDRGRRVGAGERAVAAGPLIGHRRILEAVELHHVARTNRLPRSDIQLRRLRHGYRHTTRNGTALELGFHAVGRGVGGRHLHAGSFQITGVPGVFVHTLYEGGERDRLSRTNSGVRSGFYYGGRHHDDGDGVFLHTGVVRRCAGVKQRFVGRNDQIVQRIGREDRVGRRPLVFDVLEIARFVHGRHDGHLLAHAVAFFIGDERQRHIGQRIDAHVDAVQHLTFGRGQRGEQPETFARRGADRLGVDLRDLIGGRENQPRSGGAAVGLNHSGFAQAEEGGVAHVQIDARGNDADGHRSGIGAEIAFARTDQRVGGRHVRQRERIGNGVVVQSGRRRPLVTGRGVGREVALRQRDGEGFAERRVGDQRGELELIDGDGDGVGRHTAGQTHRHGDLLLVDGGEDLDRLCVRVADEVGGEELQPGVVHIVQRSQCDAVARTDFQNVVRFQRHFGADQFHRDLIGVGALTECSDHTDDDVLRGQDGQFVGELSGFNDVDRLPEVVGGSRNEEGRGAVGADQRAVVAGVDFHVQRIADFHDQRFENDVATTEVVTQRDLDGFHAFHQIIGQDADGEEEFGFARLENDGRRDGEGVILSVGRRSADGHVEGGDVVLRVAQSDGDDVVLEGTFLHEVVDAVLELYVQFRASAANVRDEYTRIEAGITAIRHGEFEVVRLAGRHVDARRQALFSAEKIAGQSVVDDVLALLVVAVVLPVQFVIHTVDFHRRTIG